MTSVIEVSLRKVPITALHSNFDPNKKVHSVGAVKQSISDHRFNSL